MGRDDFLETVDGAEQVAVQRRLQRRHVGAFPVRATGFAPFGCGKAFAGNWIGRGLAHAAQEQPAQGVGEDESRIGFQRPAEMLHGVAAPGEEAAHGRIEGVGRVGTVGTEM